MTNNMVSLSPLDTERFGIVSARANDVTAESLPEVIHFCHENDVKFLVARCSSKDVQAVHAMEANGFLLMDTVVYFQHNPQKDPIPHYTPLSYTIESLSPTDIDDLVSVARISFSKHNGHYHVDPRLDIAKATEVYSSWAENCCRNPKVADHVIVAKADGKVAGFKAIRFNSPEETEFILGCVSPEMRKRGVYQNLAIEGLRWSKAAGVTKMINSTILTNLPIINASIKLNFKLEKSNHTFHKWFD